MKIPMVRPSPPRLSLALQDLQALEESGTFSNFGPVNTRFEQEILRGLFADDGACTTICNATIGLMLAIKDVVGDVAPGRYALMPSFTFAAAAHAALWCGLTPLCCDIDPNTWAADSSAEAEMLSKYGSKIAVVVPYATFGYPIDLEHYNRLSSQFGVPVVVDGAASLGTIDLQGRNFGTGFQGSVVFSMHATKSFAVGEAGLIYSANPERIARLRIMSSFGFGDPRTATMPGLNGKMSEVTALLGRLRLADYGSITAHRAALLDRYRQTVPDLIFQEQAPGVQAHQFVPALLPSQLGSRRAAIRMELAEKGILTGNYFSPHLMEQPYFQRVCVSSALPVCDDVGGRIVSLPLYDSMTVDEVDYVVENLNALLGASSSKPKVARKPARSEQQVQLPYAATRRANEEIIVE